VPLSFPETLAQKVRDSPRNCQKPGPGCKALHRTGKCGRWSLTNSLLCSAGSMSTQVLHHRAHGCQLSPQHSPTWSVQTRSQIVPVQACNMKSRQQCCRECSHHSLALQSMHLVYGTAPPGGPPESGETLDHVTKIIQYCNKNSNSHDLQSKVWSQPPETAVRMNAFPSTPPVT